MSGRNDVAVEPASEHAEWTTPDRTAGIDTQGGQMNLPLSRGTQMTRAEEAFDAGETPADANPIDLRERFEHGLGRQLAAARERAGLTVADVASRLKLPIRLVERIEADDYAGISDGVFLRGYLASYARLVDVPIEFATRVAAAHAHTAPLVATGTISRTRYLFERYSVGATYLVLTAIIVVPAVWLATHGGLEQTFVRTAPLDPPARIMTPVAMPPADALAQRDDNTAEAPANVTTGPVEPPPVIASMAPFTSASAPQPEPAPATTQAVAAGHALVLQLAEQSWVEIIATDGRRIEYGMLAGGSAHTYRTDGAVSVRIGNAQGATLSIDGRALEIAPYQRANVAHFRVLADGSTGRAERAEQ